MSTLGIDVMAVVDAIYNMVGGMRQVRRCRDFERRSCRGGERQGYCVGFRVGADNRKESGWSRMEGQRRKGVAGPR